MNLLNGYLAITQLLSPKEFRQDAAVHIIFEHMALEISNAITARKKELPNEDCLFVLTCKMYKFSDYKKAYPTVFKGGE